MKGWSLVFCAALSSCSRRDAAQSIDASRNVLGSASAQADDAGLLRTDAGADGGLLRADAGADGGLLRADAGADRGLLRADAGTGLDAGGGCRLLGGPFELSRRGGAALVSRGDEIAAVLNDDGHPNVSYFRAGPLVPSVLNPVRTSSLRARALRVPCAVTGELTFCPDGTGAVHRSALSGADAQTVAHSHAGTRVSAAHLMDGVSALVYLASRQTSEGWVREAWLTSEDGRPVRLSEDGSGATSSTLVARGSSLVAITVDSRVALTAMHAREVHYDHGLRMGEDVVTFVGGPGDSTSAAAAALLPSGTGWALLPIARDVSDFGLAIVKIDDPPRVDEPVVWSVYPDGLDPAPVATALSAGRAWVARVRPRSRGPGAPRELEVGELGLDGTFVPKHVVAAAAGATDVTLAADARGALWLAWIDPSGTRMERLSCL